MLNCVSDFYIGKQPENGFVGAFVEQGYTVALLIEESSDQDGQKIIDGLKKALIESTVTDLASFENAISTSMVALNVPVHFSLAAGYLHDTVLYLKTVGRGEIYYRRGKDFALLISGDKSASGYVQDFDCAVFTIDQIKTVLGQTEDIKAFVDLYAPKDLVEKLKAESYDEEERGFVVIFSECSSQLAATTQLNQAHESEISSPPLSNPVPRSTRVLNWKHRLASRKILALVTACVFFIILLWSVVFGYQRRADALLRKEIDDKQGQIVNILSKAQEESFYDTNASLELLAKAKQQLAALKQKSGEKFQTELGIIGKKIADAETAILKKEEKSANEYYDFALEHKDAKGSSLAYDGKLIAVLDTGRKTVYVLDMSDKSLTQFTDGHVAESKHVALYEGKVYLFSPTSGIYTFTSENKIKNVIPLDKEWGSIVAMQVYSGNIYLLDSKEKTIHKYLATESGFSDKLHYLQSDSDSNLADSSDLTIDSSLYVSSGDRIFKYLRGSAEEFKTDFPDRSRTLTGVFTDSDTDELYTWDSKKGVLYVLDKKGAYLKQFDVSTLHSASGVFVAKKTAYILSGSKIYSVVVE